MQTSASVDADIRVGRCRHPRQSVQTSASVGADAISRTSFCIFRTFLLASNCHFCYICNRIIDTFALKQIYY
ncbi:hypothetical protein HMPREF0673_00665 [Leyella stercorea DSM 18206]|uniref:Uncharacterized protein n=1 Tax=Leyella stercorea DSM 18206 TaxID=1002367 RepID=G6AVM8_9BACT|nr:hypothetical protein HMPREF0673_00665 [Leyella stercorea DSM 18206]